MSRAGLIGRLPVAIFMAVLAAAVSMAARAQDSQDIGALNKQVEQLYRDGKYAEATPIAEQVLAQAERTLGNEHADTLTSVKNLADLYYEQNRHAEAGPLFTRALEVRERVLGPEHPDTLASVNDLAIFNQAQEQFAEAEPLYRRALEARERVLGPEHPDTLASLDLLAGFLHAQRRYDEAEPLMRRALDVSERALGPNTETLSRAIILTQLYLNQSRAPDAMPLLKRALEIQEQLAGPEDPNTLTIAEGLARLYQSQDRFGEAAPLYRRVLEARERGLGGDAPLTIEGVINLAGLYKEDGRFGEAEPLFARALETRERMLGRESPETIMSVVDLARIRAAQAHYGEAEPLFRRALETRERMLGPEHADTLVSVDDLGKLHASQNHFAEAEVLMQRSVNTRERVLGAEHADTLQSKRNLAEMYLAEGRYSAAEPLYRYVLETKERTLGKDHVDTISGLTSLAHLFLAQNRDTEAEPLLKYALEAGERERGADHVETLVAVSNLAALFMKQGRTDEAVPLLERAMQSFERVRGKDHPQTLAMLYNLTLAYSVRGRYPEAELLAKRALETTERAYGKDHPDTILHVSNLANLYSFQNRVDEAEPLYRRVVEATERSFGKADDGTVMARHNLAELYTTQRRYGEAETLLRAALEVTEKVPDGQNHHLMLAKMGFLRFLQRDWTQAANFWRGSTATIVQRARRDGVSAGLTGKKLSEVEQLSPQFGGLVKSVYRLTGKRPGSDRSGASETFQTAQWALSSEAARSLAQMAARGAKGDPALAAVARERQDLVAEWKTRDALRNAALAKAPDKRDAKVEAENSARLTAIDQRITAIDKRLAAEFPDYAALASPVPLSVEEVQAQLGADEALILFLDLAEYGPTPDETFIWVVTKTRMRWVRSDLGTAALTREVQALRCGLDEEEWGTVSNARRCGDLLGLADMPEAARPLPFNLGKAHALYKALFGQVAEVIAGKRLLIVPSGALTSLPFQVLVTRKPKTALPKTFEGYRNIAWLGRKNAITTLPAVSSLKALRQHAADRRPATDAYAGFGNPLLGGDGASCMSANTPAACPGIEVSRRRASVGTIERATIRGGGSRNASANMDLVFAKGATPVALREQVRGLCPLADTAYEINCVAERFKGRHPLIRLAGEATEANIKALSQSGELARYRVLHLATHGLLSGDVERMALRQGEPALVLTPPENPADDGDDGLLMASEVAGLKLNADWVVLSACNTAAGDQIGGQALSGLARAFFYAGGRTLLVSHWPVYSDAAVRLTTRAFAELDRDPKAGRAEALQRAMIALMDDGSQTDNAHPAVWAPFIVVGEGGDVGARRPPPPPARK